jgi:mannose-6-phosphate isomerase
MYPIRFKPAYQSYVWGGERIPKIFHRPLPPGRYAESWEISDRDEGMCIVENGEWKGRSLRELCRTLKEKLVGKGKSWEKFPLLLKIIDAKENLSVQVHPDEETAARFQAEPKTEMWIALERSAVYAGLKQGTTQTAFAEAIEKKRAEYLLEKVELQTGDSILIPSGRIHAICAGALVLEIQQYSNTTYRLYDWGRTGRELHLEQGLASVHWDKQRAEKIAPSFAQTDGHHRLESIASTPYFIVERLEIADRWQLKSHAKTFQILFCAKGEAILENEPLRPGMTYLIPAASPPMSIIGHCQLVSIRLP